MPPKRKRNTDDDHQPIATSTRSTRRSTRAANASEVAIETATAKKPRTTKRSKKQAVNQSSEDERDESIEEATKGRRIERQTGTTVMKSGAGTEAEKISKPIDPLQPGTYTKKRCLSLFNHYAEKEDDVEPGTQPKISPDGVMSICQDANISLEGVQPIILAWICDCKAMGSIKETEWMGGMEPLQVDTVEKLALALNDIEVQLYDRASVVDLCDHPQSPYRKSKLREINADPEKAFRGFYFFAFELGRVGSNRNIDMDTALAFWEVILKPKLPQVVNFTEYIAEMNQNEDAKVYKAVTRDLWKMLYQFLQDIQPDFSNYNADGEWPSTIDAYVEWRKSKGNTPASKGR